ncbi:Alpha/Beta hydrolase protein [Mycena capillaripes]|nr:Alpha/Beta hydrolase protein [Mycena capillaripes]
MSGDNLRLSLGRHLGSFMVPRLTESCPSKECVLVKRPPDSFGGSLWSHSFLRAHITRLHWLLPAYSKDCLFLNVWAPSTNTKEKKPVVFWTNIFGFPASRDLPIAENNLGFLDQELALRANRVSVGSAIVRNRVNTPFRAGIMLSGAQTLSSPIPSFDGFDAFVETFGCSQTPGLACLNCLKRFPHQIFGTSQMGHLLASLDLSLTIFSNPLERIRAGVMAKVPIMLGNMENDRGVFAVRMTNLTAFLEGEVPGVALSPDFMRSLYPG